ncbi:MAG: PA0069 family radical SAM protein [Bacteroidia bacterium]|nr:PA0069 family radical SAM protein [Bacteroidia bacterium]
MKNHQTLTTTPNQISGRGAQLNTANRFLKHALVTEHVEGLDEVLYSNTKTQVFIENSKTIVNKMTSPDINMLNTINPYQGCEHGCIYCYARNTHNYYGFSAGLDFEQKIIAKPHAATLLRKHFENKNYTCQPITLSGNTDCYQPLERKYKITRALLEVMLAYKNPVGIITKNSLMLRDIDILTQLAQYNLVHVMVSVTSLREELRLLMEPRTATAKKRLQLIEELAKNNIPVGVMTAPIIPGLNSDEIPELIKAAAHAGACTAGYTIVRLNGDIKTIFNDWLYKTLPHAAYKIWNQIKACHNGQVNDSRWGKRMSGDGPMAESIKQLFKMAKNKYMNGRTMPAYDITLFKRPIYTGQQLELF